MRRCRIAREVIGPHIGLAVDANQRWDVGVAIPWLERLRPFNLAWVEEPTSPDDVLGHATIRKAVRPVPISTGEHTQNRVIFKQLFQAQAVDLVQIDAARVGGVNENLAILLMAASLASGLPACGRRGFASWCSISPWLTMSRSAPTADRRLSMSTTRISISSSRCTRDGRYLAPELPGFSAEIRPASSPNSSSQTACMALEGGLWLSRHLRR